jgi:hypothetical protein
MGDTLQSTYCGTLSSRALLRRRALIGGTTWQFEPNPAEPEYVDDASPLFLDLYDVAYAFSYSLSDRLTSAGKESREPRAQPSRV